MRRLLLFSLAITTALACTISVDEYPDAYGQALCSYHDRCEADTDVQECAQTISAWVELLQDEDCYDPAEGARCVSSINALACNEDTDAAQCEYVYSNCR